MERFGPRQAGLRPCKRRCLVFFTILSFNLHFVSSKDYLSRCVHQFSDFLKFLSAPLSLLLRLSIFVFMSDSDIVACVVVHIGITPPIAVVQYCDRDGDRLNALIFCNMPLCSNWLELRPRHGVRFEAAVGAWIE